MRKDTMSGHFNLCRFVDAQDAVYPEVLKELGRGMKTGHWMWYIFPQIHGLGHSALSRLYSIESIEEARAYRAHPILGQRLVECTELVVMADGRSAEQIFGYPDNMKFRSCVTLFARVDGGQPVFQRALDKYFEGVPDQLTIRILADATDETGC